MSITSAPALPSSEVLTSSALSATETDSPVEGPGDSAPGDSGGDSGSGKKCKGRTWYGVCKEYEGGDEGKDGNEL